MHRWALRAQTIGIVMRAATRFARSTFGAHAHYIRRTLNVVPIEIDVHAIFAILTWHECNAIFVLNQLLHGAHQRMFVVYDVNVKFAANTDATSINLEGVRSHRHGTI